MSVRLSPDKLQPAIEGLLKLQERQKGNVLDILESLLEETPVFDDAIAGAKARIEPLHQAEATRLSRKEGLEVSFEHMRQAPCPNPELELLNGTRHSNLRHSAYGVITEHRKFFMDRLDQGHHGQTVGELLRAFLTCDPGSKAGFISLRLNQCRHESYMVSILTEHLIEGAPDVEPELRDFLIKILPILLEVRGSEQEYTIDEENFSVELAPPRQPKARIYPGERDVLERPVNIRELRVPRNGNPDERSLYFVLKRVLEQERYGLSKEPGFRAKDRLTSPEGIDALVDLIAGDQANTRVTDYDEFARALVDASRQKIKDQLAASLQESAYQEIMDEASLQWPDQARELFEQTRRDKVRNWTSQEAVEGAGGEELSSLAAKWALVDQTRMPFVGWAARIGIALGTPHRFADLDKEFKATEQDSRVQDLHDLYRTAELLMSYGRALYEEGEESLGAEFVVLAEALSVELKQGVNNLKARGTIPMLREESPLEVWSQVLQEIVDEMVNNVAPPDTAGRFMDAVRRDLGFQRDARKEVSAAGRVARRANHVPSQRSAGPQRSVTDSGEQTPPQPGARRPQRERQ